MKPSDKWTQFLSAQLTVPKAFTIIYTVELGKPYVFQKQGIESVRTRNDTEGRGKG